MLVSVAALTALMSLQSTSRLSEAYDTAARTTLGGIATTFEEGFVPSDLETPSALQAEMRRLKAGLAELHKISLSWRAQDGGTMLVQAGHEHDPDGTKRDVTTARVVPSAGRNPAPFDAPDFSYREERAAQAHYARLERPIGLDPSTGSHLAVLELHYDLAALDAARGREQRSLIAIGMLGAVTVALLLLVMLTKGVVRPLDGIRLAANAIRHGDRGLRLRWTRRDELGDLARDFDLLADALLEAAKDPLTGLLNHRAFQERLGQELARAGRAEQSLALIAIDVDSFRAVNDIHGLEAGDALLRDVAMAISSSVRPFDVCGRVAGDEFMLALSGIQPHEALAVTDRIGAALASGDERRGFRSTLSAGVAIYPEHANEQERLIELAEGAMYWAKTNGRSRTVLCRPDAVETLSPKRAAEQHLRAGLVRTVHALARAVDAKDGYTHAHSHRVAEYAVALSRAAGLEPDHVEAIRTAGVLHDVGKIGIPDAILLKPGRLDADEFATMKRHSELGHNIVAGAGLEDVAEWVLHLHERYDGHGYPTGLTGDEIPLESRILHCADALEAMTSSRVYRAGLPVDAALEQLESGAGSQFDPHLASLLVQLVRSGELIVHGDAAPATAVGEPSAATTVGLA